MSIFNKLPRELLRMSQFWSLWTPEDIKRANFSVHCFVWTWTTALFDWHGTDFCLCMDS